MPPNNTSKQLGDVTLPIPLVPLNPLFRKPRMNTLSRNLRRESERLKTFESWPVSFLEPRTLAAEGFYYLGQNDLVRCAFCGVEIGCWEEKDNVAQDHAKWSEDCDLVLKRPCGNIPLAEDGTAEDDPSSYDTCGPFGTEIRPFSGPERAVETNTLWRDLEHLGVSKTSGPIRPYYSTYESRIASFSTWPIGHVQRPEALAEAGFFYLKFHDHTVCFHCGGGLKDWEADDDPWVEHARWFSKCGFIIIQKGREYVNEVISNNKAVLSGKAVKELRPPLKVEEEGEEGEAESQPAPSDEPQPATSATSMVAVKEPEGRKDEGGSSASKELSLCLICYSQERAIVFLPCGHFVSCVKCAPSLTCCALCRKPYEATIRAYLS